MRRTLITALALMTACGRADEPAPATAEPRDVTIADFVGTWEGTVMTQDSDAAVAHIELLASPREDGWSFTVVSVANPARSTTSPSRVISYGGDSVIVEAGPFASVLREGETVSTHSVYRLRGDRLEGTIHASYSSGMDVVLRAEARRRP